MPLAMRFRKNQSIRVAPGWHDASRKGIYLATIELDGRPWYVVQLESDDEPTLMMPGTIEEAPDKKTNKLPKHLPVAGSLAASPQLHVY